LGYRPPQGGLVPHVLRKERLEEDAMRVLTMCAHPNPKSFCHAALEQFTKGLEEMGHASEVVDLHAIRFDENRRK
jgi:hypothetical protein